MTISIHDDVEKEFRRVVYDLYGRHKGALGRAITEAVRQWAFEKTQEEVKNDALSLMDKSQPLGKRLYKERSELYGR